MGTDGGRQRAPRGIAGPQRGRYAKAELALRRARRRLVEATQWVSPSLLVPLSAPWIPSSIGFVCVYRARNADVVRRLIAQLPPGAAVRLWALDHPTDELAAHTVGEGQGGRLDLLARLVEALPETPEMLIVSDDDVRFIVGDIRRLLAAGALLDFDLFQPAHSARSQTAFQFTRKKRSLFARESTFVEQGPMIVLSRTAQTHLLPFPTDFGMGWGIEVRWFRIAAEHDLRLGVVDAVAVRHLRQGRPTYDTSGEFERLGRELTDAGLTHVSDLQRITRRIGPVEAWRRTRDGGPPEGRPAVDR